MDQQEDYYSDDADWRTTAEAHRETLQEILDLSTTELDTDQLRPALLTIAGFARSALAGDAR